MAFPEKTEIATTKPTLGWVVNHGVPGGAQRAYRILVSTDLERLRCEVGEVWDTGRVESSCSINIVYNGSRLCPGVSYYWTVRTWGEEGGASPWAEPQRFVVGQAGAVSVYPPEVCGVAAVKCEYLPSGNWLMDFGRDAFGWLEIDGSVLDREMEIEVRMGERLEAGRVDAHPEGTVRYAAARMVLRPGEKARRVEIAANLRNTGCDPGIPDSRLAVRLPEEFGVVMPFRYVELAGCPADFPVGEAVRMLRVQYVFDEQAAFFASSYERLDQVWELCRYTVLATSFAGYYVDGDRERIPYEADAYINQLCHYAVDREFSLARRTFERLMEHPTWPTEWRQHMVFMAWADYMATGDLRLLERHYDALKAEKLLLAYAREDGLVDSGALRDIVDWPVSERDGYEFRPVNTVVNAFHYRTLVLMGRIARALGKVADAVDFEREAARVRERFNAVLFDGERGCYVDGEGAAHTALHASVFPLAFGLVPEAWVPRVAEFVKSRGMACSVYVAQYLLEALFKAGEVDAAVELMTSGGLRSWWNMLRMGGTMTWEAWDQSLKPNQDWNHAWGAAPGNIVGRYVLGVRSLEPGYGRVAVEPRLGGLAFVKGRVPTIRGSIEVKAWRDAAGQVRKEVRVPANVKVENA